ncbi:MAG: ATP-binding protein, partial [Patescibacteria group bacterium]
MVETPNVYAPTAPAPAAGSPATLSDLAQTIAAGAVSVQDIIAPPSIDVDFNHLKIGETFVRTLFVSGYPRFVGANWLSPLINFNHTLTLSMFYYPVESKGVLDDLRRKIAEMEATIKENEKSGRVADPTVEAAVEDARSLQEQLVKGTERFFQFSFYITISADSMEELDAVTKKVESTLGSLLLLSKHATLRMEEAFQSTIPTCLDKLKIMRNMDTTSIATTFPLTSSELTANEGILYGINEHNGSLIIFDRFSLENANTVVFAKSGAGKSYMVKLEAIRSLMFGTEVMVIDPEKEYEQLSKNIGGDYITFSPASPAKINPFDMSGTYEEGENELALKILSLHTLFKVIMGQLTPAEDALLDRTLLETYAKKGITQDSTTHQNPAPVMADLYAVLKANPEGQSLADRVEQYVTGSLKGIFDQPSTVDIRNTFTVFSTRDLEEKVRPVAMYIILDFIWSRIRREIKKRVLVVDEAWYLMQHPDSAVFMYSIAKRARKYYLGLTTITQDVADFLRSDYGKAIVTNSSIQILLKQHPAAIDEITRVFYLSEGEKRILLAANVGEGLFFAGPNHVAMQVVASPEEHPLATSSPKEILEIREKLEKEAREKGLPTEATPPS